MRQHRRRGRLPALPPLLPWPTSATCGRHHAPAGQRAPNWPAIRPPAPAGHPGRRARPGLAPRERSLLATVPQLLGRRFEQLHQAHRGTLPADGADDPARWLQPGTWLTRFCHDMKAVLQAELDLRLQPVAGLLEALNEVTTQTMNRKLAVTALPAGPAGRRLEPASSYIGHSPLALTMTALIGVAYLAGGLELLRFQQATASLGQALENIPDPPDNLADWLGQVHPSLQTAVRLRVEGERAGLPGPADALPGGAAGAAGHARHLPRHGGHPQRRGAGPGEHHRPARHPRRAGRPVRGPGGGLRHLGGRRRHLGDAGPGVPPVPPPAAAGRPAARPPGSPARCGASPSATSAGRPSRPSTPRPQAMPGGECPQAAVAQLERHNQQLGGRLLAGRGKPTTAKPRPPCRAGPRRWTPGPPRGLVQSARMAGEVIRPAVEATMGGIARETTHPARSPSPDTVSAQLDGLAGRFDAPSPSPTPGPAALAPPRGRQRRPSPPASTPPWAARPTHLQDVRRRLLASVGSTRRCRPSWPAASPASARSQPEHSTKSKPPAWAGRVTGQLDSLARAPSPTRRVTTVADGWTSALARHERAPPSSPSAGPRPPTRAALRPSSVLDTALARHRGGDALAPESHARRPSAAPTPATPGHHRPGPRRHRRRKPAAAAASPTRVGQLEAWPGASAPPSPPSPTAGPPPSPATRPTSGPSPVTPATPSPPSSPTSARAAPAQLDALPRRPCHAAGRTGQPRRPPPRRNHPGPRRPRRLAAAALARDAGGAAKPARTRDHRTLDETAAPSRQHAGRGPATIAEVERLMLTAAPRRRRGHRPAAPGAVRQHRPRQQPARRAQPHHGNPGRLLDAISHASAEQKGRHRRAGHVVSQPARAGWRRIQRGLPPKADPPATRRAPPRIAGGAVGSPAHLRAGGFRGGALRRSQPAAHEALATHRGRPRPDPLAPAAPGAARLRDVAQARRSSGLPSWPSPAADRRRPPQQLRPASGH